ncbi:AUGMIN subunit 4-like protein [Drosera capensis]
MVRGMRQQQNRSPDVVQLIEQLERHCLASDDNGSLISKSAFADLRLAREEMCRERLRYLEAMAIYAEAIAMLEEYQQANAVGNLGGIRDVHGMYPQLGLKSSPQGFGAYPLICKIYSGDDKIRMYLVEATEEASIAYNRAVTRLREYQGVDPHFHGIAKQYHEIVRKLESMQWTTRQVEMDL